MAVVEQRAHGREGRNIRVLAQLQQGIDHLLIVQTAAGQGSCHGLINAVEFALQTGDIGGYRHPLPVEFIPTGAGIPALKVLTQLPDQRASIPGWIGDQAEPVTKLCCLQSVANHIQCRLFLADHQHALMASQRIGHDVDDGLTLAGAWGALDQNPGLLLGRPDGPLLGWIRRCDQEALVLWWCTWRLGHQFIVAGEAQQRGHGPVEAWTTLELLQLMGQGLRREAAQKENAGCQQLLLAARGERWVLGTALQNAFAAREDGAKDIHHLGASESSALVELIQRFLQLLKLTSRQHTLQCWVETNAIAATAIAVIHQLGKTPLGRDAKPHRPEQKGNQLGLAGNSRSA